GVSSRAPALPVIMVLHGSARSPEVTHDPATRHVTRRPADPWLYAVPLSARVVSGGVGGVPGEASAGDLDVFRLGSLLALGDVELDLLPFLQAAVAATSDRAEVHEHVLATKNQADTFG